MKISKFGQRAFNKYPEGNSDESAYVTLMETAIETFVEGAYATAKPTQTVQMLRAALFTNYRDAAKQVKATHPNFVASLVLQDITSVISATIKQEQ